MAVEMTMASWYIAQNGSVFGPITYGQLAKSFARNEVGYVWCDDWSDWASAGRVLGKGGVAHPHQNLPINAGREGITYTLVEGASVKFATIIRIFVGILIPLWPVSLPICWYRAYCSYKRPTCRTFVLRST
jgi:GYF domain 2